MVRPHSLIHIISIQLVDLKKLVKLRLGVLHSPVSVKARVHVEVFRLFHVLLLLHSVDVRKLTFFALVAVVRLVGRTHRVGAHATLRRNTECVVNTSSTQISQIEVYVCNDKIKAFSKCALKCVQGNAIIRIFVSLFGRANIQNGLLKLK